MAHRSAMYTVDEWHDFYVMVGGAAAVLTGLIFVAISIHLRQVIATPLFRARARYLTAGLLLSLLTSGLVLVPKQSVTVLGVELIALGLALPAAFAVRLRASRSDLGRRPRSTYAFVNYQGQFVSRCGCSAASA